MHPERMRRARNQMIKIPTQKFMELICAFENDLGKLYVTNDSVIFRSFYHEYDIHIPLENIVAINKKGFLSRKNLQIKSPTSKWVFSHFESDLSSIVPKLKAAVVQNMLM